MGREVYHRRPLRPGDRVRLTQDGAVRTVRRTTPCAAYVSGEPREVQLPDGRTFPSTSGVLAISPWSFVFPAEDGDGS